MKRVVERCSLQAGVAVMLCATLSGCFGVTPLPKRTRTPEGTVVTSIDLSFIHPGHTTRAEVKEKLKLIDTGFQGEHFFLGRWSSSGLGGWIVSLDQAVEAGRAWTSGNLLVEFDEAGIVKRSETFDDGKAITHLASVAADTPLQLSPPLELQVKYWRLLNAHDRPVAAKIVLSASSFDFEGFIDRKKNAKFSLPRGDILRAETPFTIRDTDPTYASVRLRCARDLKKLGGPRGKDLNFEVTLPQLVMLMNYVSTPERNSALGVSGQSPQK